MRVVSLVPSGTEIAFALGLDEQIVGVSHACRYPAHTKNLPKVTCSVIDLPAGASSAEIDGAYSSQVAAGQPRYQLEEQLLVELQPDILLVQDICTVCAIDRETVESAIARLQLPTQLVQVHAVSLGGILDSIRVVGEATGKAFEAGQLVADLEGRLDHVRQAVAGVARPRVACLEWLDPIYCAGHWVPEMVEIAGGQDMIGRPGMPSVPVAWEDVLEARPEAIVMMPCSVPVAEALEQIDLVANRPGWDSLPAVQAGRVWVVKSGYFSRHSQRTFLGVEVLAHLFHPDRLPVGADWDPDAFAAVPPRIGQAQ